MDECPLSQEELEVFREKGKYNDGDKIEVLSNGSIMNKSKGRILKGAPLSSSQAFALAHRRWEKHVQLAEDAITERASLRGHGKTYDQAFKHMVANQFDMASDPGQGRAAVNAFNQMLKVLNAVPMGRGQAGVQDSGGVTIGRALSLELADKLINAAIEAKSKQTVIDEDEIEDAEWSDADTS